MKPYVNPIKLMKAYGSPVKNHYENQCKTHETPTKTLCKPYGNLMKARWKNP
jgi:hypothetical protein